MATCSRPVRYLLVGGTAWLADVAIFLFFVGGVGIAAAQLFARATGAVVAFFGHKWLVFEEKDNETATLRRQALAYAGLWILAYGVGTSALIVLIDQLGLQPLVAKILVEIAIVAMNYLVMKEWIFRASAKKGKEE